MRFPGSSLPEFQNHLHCIEMNPYFGPEWNASSEDLTRYCVSNSDAESTISFDSECIFSDCDPEEWYCEICDRNAENVELRNS
jgi:hypothetical protein